MGAQIRLSVQVMDRPSCHDIYMAITLERSLVEEAFTPIDLPDRTADGFERAICTPTHKILKVNMKREEVAKMLTDKIIGIMESNDTIMGYKK